MTTTSEATTKDTQQLLIANLNIVANAIQNKTKVGRGASNKLNLYGIKKIRQLILDLAVRGLLVPQDNNDEPASELLKKIATEKSELIKQGKIKKQKPLPVISEDEKTFAIPDSWQWVRLENLCILENGDRGKNYPNKSLLVNSGIPFVNAGHLQNGLIDKSNMTFITEERYNILSGGKFKEKDILFCLRGSLGKTAVVTKLKKGAIASSLVIIRLLSKINNRYIFNYFNSLLLFDTISLYDNGTAQPNLSASDLKKFCIPLPPLAEQQRIVAKVDELMALCDQLEQQQQDSITTHNTLVTTLLNALTNANNKQEFNNTWTTITDNFALLFTTKQSIDELKQCILQLAVMGKLVPQDASDEPASVLLEKIATEKAGLIKQGKIKKQKPLPAISEAEKPFAIPDSWQWVRLGEISNYGITDKTESINISDSIWVLELEDIEKHTSKLLKKIRHADRKFKSTKNKFNKGDIIYSKLRPYLDKVIIADEDGLCTTEMIPFKSYFGISSNFIKLFMKTNYFINYANTSTHGMNLPRLSTDNARIALIPITSLAEQQRIVAKVDELMAICDNLKQALAETQQLQLNLADATVEHIF